METRRLFIAMFAALAVYVLYMYFYNTLFPPPKQPAQPPAATRSADQPYPATSQPAPGGSTASAPASEAPQTQPAATSASEMYFESYPDASEVTLGGPGKPLELVLDPRGAAVKTIRLTAKRKDGKYVHRATAEGNDPYVLVRPVTDAGAIYESFVTGRVWVTFGEHTQSWPLTDLRWKLVDPGPGRAVFETVLREKDTGRARLRLRKVYALVPDKPLVTLRLEAENLSDEPASIALEQDGAVGISKEQIRFDMRYLIVATRDESGKLSTKALQSRSLKKPGGTPIYTVGEEKAFVWVALANKYFAVVARPLDPPDGEPIVRAVKGDLADPRSHDLRRGDLRALIETQRFTVAPQEKHSISFEVYAGTKNRDDLRVVNPAFADRAQLGYVAMHDADNRCCCTFGWLTGVMIGLLENIYRVVGNYGVAIIILVLIIRLLLHPLAVFQQKSMYRTQEGMSRIQPKLAALKEKYKDDKVKLNQEMMRLYHDEGVNPMAPMIGMIPMLIQMPILIALWTGINTDIHLRHAPFDGWWITDLSSPDALIHFAQPISIPVLSWLPGIGFAFRNIPSFNMLPVLMGLSMWLQQRYMPKPHIEAKLKAAREARASGQQPEAGLGGMSIEDQMRQQNMIANVMAIVFPLMFYYMPSGLTLYWMATNVFGILESLRVRKQIERDKQRAAVAAATGQRQPGMIASFFKRIAEQAEQIQKQADQVSHKAPPSPRRAQRQKKRKKGGR